MIQDRKGLSAIVTTLIIILLAIVALGVVWSVVRNVTDSAQEQVELGEKCRSVEVTATKINDVGGIGNTYSLTLSRTGTGETDIGGVKVVFFNSTANSEVVDFGIALAPLETQTNSSIPLSNAVVGADRVDLTVYFDTEAGGEELCTNTKTVNF